MGVFMDLGGSQDEGLKTSVFYKVPSNFTVKYFEQRPNRDQIETNRPISKEDPSFRKLNKDQIDAKRNYLK